MDRRALSAKAPRLAFVLGQNMPGGTELQARALIKRLIECGIDVHVFLVDGTAGLDGLPENGVSILRQGRPSGLRAVAAYPRMAMLLRRELRAGRFAVVHSALARAYFLAAVATLGLGDVRTVTWRRGMGDHLRRHTSIKRFAERWALQRADAVIVNSEAVRQFWAAWGVPVSRFTVLPNIIEPWRFDPVPPASVAGGTSTVVSVGGLKQVKAFDVAIEALAKVQSSGRPVEFVLVGDGEERRRLADLAAAEGVRLRFVGHQLDPRPWLLAADVYVQPSLSEGTSNAILEAMAAGCAIVCTRSGGTPELVESTASLVEPGDADGLAAAVSRLLADAHLREDLGIRAQQRARAMSSPDAVVAGHLAVYGIEQPCAG